MLMAMRSIDPPRHLAELRVRAEALAGRGVDEIARALGFSLEGTALRTKGRVGELVERALGASAGSSSQPDFPALGVELKTIPLSGGRARESTFVTALRVGGADSAEWDSSAVRAKTRHILWVPLADDRTLGAPIFWQPTASQDAILRADFEELVGRIGAGGIERLSARDGRWLQVRPKAADGSARTLAPDGEGLDILTMPRGFYLRARFTSAILVDPLALPE